MAFSFAELWLQSTCTENKIALEWCLTRKILLFLWSCQKEINCLWVIISAHSRVRCYFSLASEIVKYSLVFFVLSFFNPYLGQFTVRRPLFLQLGYLRNALLVISSTVPNLWFEEIKNTQSILYGRVPVLCT